MSEGPRSNHQHPAADPGTGHRAQVTDMVNGVELVHPEVQLDDICRTNDAALTAGERLQWAGWQHARIGELRGRVLTQAVCGVLAAGAAAMGWTIREPSGWGGLVQALLLVASMLLGLAWLVIEAEMAQHAGYQPWPVRFRLGRKTREWVNLEPLRGSLDDELTCGHRADEARLVIVAKQIARAITHSSIWSSTYLDRHDLRRDVQLDLLRIARDAVELRSRRRNAARNSIDQLPPTSPPLGCDQWNDLLGRLAWLHRYQTQLELLSAPAAEPVRSATPETERITTEIRFTIMALEA